MAARPKESSSVGKDATLIRLFAGYIPAMMLGLMLGAEILDDLEPLKPVMHWDEITRYAFDGVATDRVSVASLVGAFRHFDNGRPGVVAMRLIHGLTSHNVDTTFHVYKLLIAVVTALAVARFAFLFVPREDSRSLVIGPVALVLLSPMFWLQTNEIMVEPMILPLGLMWVEATGTWMTSSSPKKRTLALLLLVAVMLAFTSLQYTLAVVGIGGLVGAFQSIPLVRRREFKAVATRLVLYGLVCAGALLIRCSVHPAGGLQAGLDEVIHVLAAARDPNFRLVSTATSDFDAWMFGVRSFFWNYWPSIPLLIPAMAGLALSWPRLQPAARFAAVFALVAVVMFAFGYRDNPQERYRYLPNVLCLIVAASGLEWIRRRYLRKRPVLTAVFIIVAGYDYVSMYRVLPCLGNLQDFGTYEDDDADCTDEPKTLVGLMSKRSIILHPHQDYTAYFPNAMPGQTQPSKAEIWSTVSDRLAQGRYPMVLAGPNYFNRVTVELMYRRKYGEWPQSDMPKMLIALSFAETSRHFSAVYGPLEKRSETVAAAAWREWLATGEYQVLVDEQTPDYTLRVATAIDGAAKVKP